LGGSAQCIWAQAFLGMKLLLRAVSPKWSHEELICEESQVSSVLRASLGPGGVAVTLSWTAPGWLRLAAVWGSVSGNYGRSMLSQMLADTFSNYLHCIFTREEKRRQGMVGVGHTAACNSWALGLLCAIKS
jgi:hypothetical protein